MDLNNLADSVPEKPKAAPPAEKPYEPLIHGESAYDRVTSLLISLVMGAAMIVGFLALMDYANQAYAKKTPAPVEIIEVSGGGGGTPEGELGSSENVNVPDALPGTVASNATAAEDASSFEEPAMQEVSSAVLDAFNTSSDESSEGGEMAAESSPGTGQVGGVRASKIGNGRPGLGIGGGPGDGGVAREQRWEIVYPPGQDENEYKRQLDSLGVEIGTFSGNTVVYGSNFSGQPIRRTGLPGQEKRFYVTWRGQGRKQTDIGLLRAAGIEVGPNGAILFFYPKKVTDELSQLEFRFKGRQPGEIRKTRFQVESQGGRVGFRVVAQDPLR